jgi:hypothetical protein
VVHLAPLEREERWVSIEGGMNGELFIRIVIYKGNELGDLQQEEGDRSELIVGKLCMISSLPWCLH